MSTSTFSFFLPRAYRLLLLCHRLVLIPPVPLVAPIAHPCCQQIEAFPQPVKAALPVTQQSAQPKTLRLPTSYQPTSRLKVAIGPHCTRYALPLPTVPWSGLLKIWMGF